MPQTPPDPASRPASPSDSSSSSRPPRPAAARNLSPEKYARLQAEAKAPYRGLRRFIYLAFAASGGLGAFIFLLKAIAGQDLGQTLPNLALQLGLVAGIVWLWKIDKPKEK